MLSSHKKNILIGLLALGLFGLVYGYLNSRPEMIADESLRVAEVPRPEFDRVVSRPSAFKPEDSLGTDSMNTDSVSKGALQETGGEHLVSAMEDALADDKSDQSTSILADTVTMASAASPDVIDDSEDMIQLEEAVVSQPTDNGMVEAPLEIAGVKDPYKNPFKSGPRYSTPAQSGEQADGEPVSSAEDAIVSAVSEESDHESFRDLNEANLNNAEVPLISEQQSGFLDLNLTDEKPIEVTLLEGDEIIIDDVNETLGKFQPLVAEVSSQESLESKGESTVTSVSQVSMNIVSPFTLSAEKNNLQDQSSELVVLPDPDQELMSGSDEVSLEYQASYKKLASITDKLKAANEENSALKNQFSKVADDNRKLAQIIRDIDEKIKVLTANN